MPDAAYFRKLASKCRQLARASREREAKILNDMADEHEAKAIELEQK